MTSEKARAVVDEAIDRLLYDVERETRDAWVTVDLLKAHCAAVEAECRRWKEHARVSEAVLDEQMAWKEAAYRALAAQAWAVATLTLKAWNDLETVGPIYARLAELPAPHDFISFHNAPSTTVEE